MQRRRGEKDEALSGDLQGDFQGGWSGAEAGRPAWRAGREKQIRGAAHTASQASWRFEFCRVEGSLLADESCAQIGVEKCDACGAGRTGVGRLETREA